MLGFGSSLGSTAVPSDGPAGDPTIRRDGFDGLLDALPDSVFEVESDGIVRAARLGPSNDVVSEARSVALVGGHVSDVLGPAATSAVMGGVGEALGTGEVISRVWDAGSISEGNRSYRHGTFSRSSSDSVLVITRDVTAERSRSDADRLVLDIGHRLIAQPLQDLEAAVADALRRTTSFVGGRGALLLVPDDNAQQGFTIVSSWTPTAIGSDVLNLEPEKRNWFAGFVEGLEEPVVLNSADVPAEARAMRWVVSEYGLAAIGLIPTVCEPNRLGVIAIGFPSSPDRVSRLRFGALSPLGHLVSGARERHQRESERWMRDAEDGFRATVRHSADITLVVGVDGRLVFVSSSVQELLGFEPAELIGRNGFEFMHPEDFERASGRFDELGSKRGTAGGDIFRIRHRDGSWRSFEGIITDQRDDPTVGGFVAVAREVTERLAAEGALRESEQRFRQLAERASDMIYRFMLRPEPRLEYMSPAARSTTGYSPEELYADPSLMLGRVHPDDRDAVLAQLTNPGTASRQLRVRWQHRDGNWGWTEHRVVPLLDEEGRLAGVEGVARDVTEQVRAETQLVESDQLSRSVLESIPGPTAVLDSSGTIVMTNDSWASHMGDSDDRDLSRSGIGANYVALCEEAAEGHVEGAAEVAAGVRAVLTGGQESFRLDYPVPGERDDAWAMVKVSPLRSGDGGVVVLHTDITERKRSERELAHQVLHDPLTGLPNRALLTDRLEGAIRRAEEPTRSVGILVADLDRFKAVNDTRGHAAGDDLLVAVSERLTGLVRPGDTVARVGGDEFVILCEGLTSRAEVADVAERIVARLAEPFRLGTHEAAVTASIGIALGSRSANPDTLLRDADAAMYRAKKLGRNRYEHFDRELHAKALGRLFLESELRHALDRDQLRVFYQPVMDLRTGAITGIEALLRWQHPTEGLLGPDRFLAVAEETALIVPIGTWVLREACRQQQAWLASLPNLEGLELAVNVSAEQLRRPGFVDEVLRVVGETGANPKSLSLELTETTVMEEGTGSNACRLSEAGVRLAVDDFGIAYSSLSYLKRFPVSTVKIDKSFISGLCRDPEDAAIVKAIIGIADALGLATIAEGVEQPDQRDRLLTLGCHHAQGHLYAPARPPSVIEALLRQGSIRPRPTRSVLSWRRRRRRTAAQLRA